MYHVRIQKKISYGGGAVGITSILFAWGFEILLCKFIKFEFSKGEGAQTFRPPLDLRMCII